MLVSSAISIARSFGLVQANGIPKLGQFVLTAFAMNAISNLPTASAVRGTRLCHASCQQEGHGRLYCFLLCGWKKFPVNRIWIAVKRDILHQ
jgi:hypothetical protein